jgi:hypothetical protein
MVLTDINLWNRWKPLREINMRLEPFSSSNFTQCRWSLVSSRSLATISTAASRFPSKRSDRMPLGSSTAARHMASVALSIVSMCLSHKRRGSKALALSYGFTFRRYGPHFRHNSLNSILAGSTYLAAYNRPLFRGILLMGYNGGDGSTGLCKQGVRGSNPIGPTIF